MFIFRPLFNDIVAAAAAAATAQHSFPHSNMLQLHQVISVGFNVVNYQYICLSSVIIRVRVVFRKTVGKWFEPRSISCLPSVIIWVRVVFRKTVVSDH